MHLHGADLHPAVLAVGVRELLGASGRRWRAGILVALPALVMVATTLVVIAVSGVPTTELTQDPAELVGYPWYFGLFSYFGVLLWAAAAAIALLSWAILRDSDRDRARYFLHAGLLSALFALDDLFLLHEEVLPHAVGIDELVVMAVYGAVSLAFVLRHYARVVVEGSALLVAAVVFFGGSVLLDIWDPSDLNVLVEDTLKLLGIGCWLGHFARAAARSLAPRA